MAKIGKYEIPEVGLDESLTLGKKIALEFAGQISRQGLARSMGMAERGGAFGARLGALRMWGIVTGRSRLRMTRDALMVCAPITSWAGSMHYGTIEHYLKVPLAKNVPLFVELSGRFSSGAYSAESFAVVIEELSGADRFEVSSRLPLLDRLFSEVRSLITIDPRQVERRADEIERSWVNKFAEQPQSYILDRVGHGAVETAEDPASDARDDDQEDSEKAMAELSVSDAQADVSAEYTLEESSESFDSGYTSGNRILLRFSDVELSLPETLGNLDVALSVLKERRRLVASLHPSEGHLVSDP